jgi:hypothetical protein
MTAGTTADAAEAVIESRIVITSAAVVGFMLLLLKVLEIGSRYCL